MTPTRLILIAGSPASGKTTLATRLRHDLGYPLLGKDLFKDALMETAPPATRAESQRIGVLAWAALYTALDAMLGAVPAMIVEANFQRGYAERELHPRLARCDAVVLACRADRDVVLARVRNRTGDPARHAGHFDEDAIPDLLRLLDAGAYRLDVPGVPALDIDTTSGYRPGLPTILAFAAGGGEVRSRS